MEEIYIEAPDYGQVHYSWKFREFPDYERGKNWYWLAGAVLVLMLLFSVFTANFLFALIIIMAVLILALFRQNISDVDFKITEDGIVVNDRFYDYKIIKNFYIIYEPPEVKTLYFEPKSLANPRIPISLQDQDPVAVREVLKKYLDEDLEREYEPISDQVSRIFKL